MESLRDSAPTEFGVWDNAWPSPCNHRSSRCRPPNLAWATRLLRRFISPPQPSVYAFNTSLMDLSRIRFPSRSHEMRRQLLPLFEPFARPHNPCQDLRRKNLLAFDRFIRADLVVVNFRHFRKITEPKAHTFDSLSARWPCAQCTLETAFWTIRGLSAPALRSLLRSTFFATIFQFVWRASVSIFLGLGVDFGGSRRIPIPGARINQFCIVGERHRATVLPCSKPCSGIRADQYIQGLLNGFEARTQIHLETQLAAA